jgi:hypothetical protein
MNNGHHCEVATVPGSKAQQAIERAHDSHRIEATPCL